MTTESVARLFKSIYATSCIPVNSDKTPRIKWTSYQNNLPTDLEISRWFCGNEGIAVIAGNIQCMDFDEKYSPNIFEKFRSLCSEHGLNEILRRVVVQRTPSGGFHIIFRCENDLRNQKLAMTQSGNVAIETRAGGGYFVVSPSKGYSITQGNFENIPVISSEDREELFSLARFFNEKPKEQIPYGNSNSTPGDDYDARGDIAELLRAHGWVHIGKKAWRRPGKRKGISATWDHIPKRFYVFSSSTEFEIGHAYKPWHVFAILQCGGDYKRAAKELSKLGYGVAEPPPKASLNLDIARQSLKEVQKADIFSVKEITPEDIWSKPIDPMADCLLGKRFLCKDGSWLVVASSGVGKSVLAMQMALYFSLGRILWGMDPHKPRRVVLIQAENNDLDLREPFLSITKQMKLSLEDRAVIQKNLHILSEDVLIGKDFIDYLSHIHDRYSPEIIIIDPLLSYIGADISRQDVCSIFLRNQLNPVLHKFHSGVIIIHHTGKPIKDKTFTLSDLSYLGVGSSELTNWARAVSVVKQSSDNDDVYELIHTKRGKRSGANITTYLKHSSEGICWEETWKPTPSKKFRTHRISKYDHLGLEYTPPLKHNTNDAARSELITYIISRLRAVGGDVSNENAVRVYNCARRLASPILKQLEDGRWVGRSYLPNSEDGNL